MFKVHWFKKGLVRKLPKGYNHPPSGLKLKLSLLSLYLRYNYKLIPISTLDNRVVFALDFEHRYTALGRGFKPRSRQTLYQTQAQHLCFFIILFGLFDLILLFVCQIWHVNCEAEHWKLNNFLNVLVTSQNCKASCFLLEEVSPNVFLFL